MKHTLIDAVHASGIGDPRNLSAGGPGSGRRPNGVSSDTAGFLQKKGWQRTGSTAHDASSTDGTYTHPSHPGWSVWVQNQTMTLDHDKTPGVRYGGGFTHSDNIKDMQKFHANPDKFEHQMRKIMPSEKGKLSATGTSEGAKKAWDTRGRRPHSTTVPDKSTVAKSRFDAKSRGKLAEQANDLKSHRKAQTYHERMTRAFLRVAGQHEQAGLSSTKSNWDINDASERAADLAHNSARAHSDAAYYHSEAINDIKYQPESAKKSSKFANRASAKAHAADRKTLANASYTDRI